MRFSCQPVALLLSVGLLTPGYALAQAQTTPPADSATASQAPGNALHHDTIPERIAAVQARLEALGPSDPEKPDTEKDETRAILGQLLAALTALEEAYQKRTSYTEQIAALPQRVQELEAERKQLETYTPGDLPEATDQLRDEYQARLQAAQTEVLELIRQTAAGEVRIANIPQELAQRNKTRTQLEKDLSSARGLAPMTEIQKLRVQLLEARLQLQNITIQALEAEREWLTKRVPLQDALLAVAQLRRQNLQTDLNTIKQALGQAIEEEESVLSDTAADIADRLEHTTDDPIEALLLTVSLETVEIRRQTAADRQRLNSLTDTVLEQEQHNAQVKLTVDRLSSLVEKQASGEVVGQRVLVLFQRLQRERAQYQGKFVTQLEKRLATLGGRLFAIEDTLYELDQEQEDRLEKLMAALPAATPEQQNAAVTEVRLVLDEQKAALRDQQQVLTALRQEMEELVTLHREYKRQLDDGYIFALTKIFWIRNAEPVNWRVIKDIGAGAVTAVPRLAAFTQAELAHWRVSLPHPLHLWSVLLLLFAALPWVAYQACKRLRDTLISTLDEHARREEHPGSVATILTVLRSAVWPAYLALVAWVRGEFLPHNADQSDVALVSGLQLGALILWVSSVGRGLLRRNGLAQSSWGLSREVCQSLQRSLLVLCIAALVCLVPRHILLTVPGEADTATGSLALARGLFLTLQLVVLIMVSIVVRRGNPFIQKVLTPSREKNGFLWRIWPILYAALLAGIATLIAFDLLGYHHAAQYIGSRTLESLAVVFVIRLIVMLLVWRLLHRLVNFLFALAGRSPQSDPSMEERATRDFNVLRIISNVVLSLLAGCLILEIWGVPVSWLLTAPLTVQILASGSAIALTVGLTTVVMQLSRLLTDYLLQPRTTREGIQHEASQKLRTLAPLVHTLINVGVVFIATLIILEQVGLETGPVLAGVGIFGLAIGFASQSLIKDVINGLFMLFEDSLSVGDIVELRGTAGEVEKFTLRAVTIRDLSGNVHLIPNSSIDMVTNMTKVFSRYFLEVGVAYREDVDAVIEILREVDQDLRSDYEFGKDMLEPIEILGLDRFEDSAAIIRARLKTRPIQQWRIGREFKRRMKKVFDERGIEIPVPHRTLYWGQPKEGPPPPLHIVTGQGQKDGIGGPGGEPASDDATTQPSEPAGNGRAKGA